MGSGFQWYRTYERGYKTSGSALRFMLRISSLVECVSVLHGTGVYKASILYHKELADARIIIIAIRNVWRIIIWKDLNWKMCKKDPYNCGKGPVYTVNCFRPENNLFLIDCNVHLIIFVILQLLWNICINELIYTTKNEIYIISCLRNTASHIY